MPSLIGFTCLSPLPEGPAGSFVEASNEISDLCAIRRFLGAVCCWRELDGERWTAREKRDGRWSNVFEEIEIFGLALNPLCRRSRSKAK
jgi:hypothetical protein